VPVISLNCCLAPKPLATVADRGLELSGYSLTVFTDPIAWADVLGKIILTINANIAMEYKKNLMDNTI
jgi:hypothetical protein